MPDPAAPHIRRASPSDAAALAALAARTFHETFAADNRPEDMAAYLAATFGPERQAAELADPAVDTLLATCEGALAGYAQLVAGGPAPACVTGPAPAELKRLYVARPWHGRGVAAALMDAVLRAAVARGARTLWLGVWEHNARAMAFYRKYAFTDVGAHPFVLGADVQTDRLMTRSLDGVPG